MYILNNTNAYILILLAVSSSIIITAFSCANRPREPIQKFKRSATEHTSHRQHRSEPNVESRETTDNNVSTNHQLAASAPKRSNEQQGIIVDISTTSLMRLGNLVSHVLLSISNSIDIDIDIENDNNIINMGDNGSSFSGVAAKLARPNILELQPYRCARDDYSTGVLLDANENAFGPPFLREDSDGDVLERYPDPYQIPLKQKVAEYRGCSVQPSNIFVGVGSDEAIDLLMRIFCVPGKDSILITPPTYGMYKVCAKVNDVDIIKVPLKPDFDVQIPEVSARLADVFCQSSFASSPFVSRTDETPSAPRIHFLYTYTLHHRL